MAKVGIMAYGTPDDRAKLAVLAGVMNQSSSEWLIAKIRAEYTNAFGDLAPNPGAFKSPMKS